LRILMCLCVATVSACWTPSLARAETELLVSAAASLTESFKELTKAYELKTHGVKVRGNFSGSGTLLQQIIQGAPADVFVSADQETMDRAEKGGLLVAGSRMDFVGNSLVLITPLKAVQVNGLADLKSARVQRIGMGNPNSVPAGRYAKAALEKQGLWETLAPKCVMGISVKQALEYVMRGEVEAGFVFASDAVAAKDRVRVAAEIPTGIPIVYPVALVAGSSHQAEALAFIRFLQSKEAQGILAKYGFKAELSSLPAQTKLMPFGYKKP